MSYSIADGHHEHGAEYVNEIVISVISGFLILSVIIAFIIFKCGKYYSFEWSSIRDESEWRSIRDDSLWSDIRDHSELP